MSVCAAGERPRAAEALGVEPIRYAAVAISGALAGLGGAFLSLSATGVFLET